MITKAKKLLICYNSAITTKNSKLSVHVCKPNKIIKQICKCFWAQAQHNIVSKKTYNELLIAGKAGTLTDTDRSFNHQHGLLLGVLHKVLGCQTTKSTHAHTHGLGMYRISSSGSGWPDIRPFFRIRCQTTKSTDTYTP